ncbi:MAG: NfeD family protein [Gammaproteobacteria bacterium]|nr:NfeD family protein [Gammaproteobacteria bacterium]
MGFEITFWYWWIAAAVLITLEVLAPTFYLLWMGIAAFIVGLLVWIMPSLPWEIQIITFAILAVASIVIWRNYYKKNPIGTDEPLLNRRGEQYVGRIVTLKKPIIDGVGKIKIDDSTWKVEGEDCDAGTKVKVVSIDNVIFQVEKVN